jgi:hypothetical protein
MKNTMHIIAKTVWSGLSLNVPIHIVITVPSAQRMQMIRKKRYKKGKRIVKACLSKTRHSNEDDAKDTAIWQSLQEGCGTEGCCPTFWFYRCVFCEGYHTYKE